MKNSKKKINLHQSTSGLRAKIIEVQDKKSSLMTALRLVHRDNEILAARVLSGVDGWDGDSEISKRGNYETPMTTKLLVMTRSQYDPPTNTLCDADDNANSFVQLCEKNDHATRF